MWPGPNSNTFVAAVLRAVPELATTLPPNAIGKDFRDGYPYVGLTDSRTGVEASLFGLIGVKAGWVEGIELNILGLVAGLDLRHPAVKLPGFGRDRHRQRNRDRRARARTLVARFRHTFDPRTRAARRDDARPLCDLRTEHWAARCARLGRCSNKSRSRRSGAAGSKRCRSMSAIAATRPACTATSMPARPHRGNVGARRPTSRSLPRAPAHRDARHHRRRAGAQSAFPAAGARPRATSACR